MTPQLLAAGDPRLRPVPDPSAAWLHVAPTRRPELADHRRRMLDALITQSHPLERTGRPGHFTGSALVVRPDDERVLVLHHRKLGRWLQPGGHADGDGNLAHVAWREATEETGIAGLAVVWPAVDLDVHLVDPPAEDPHDHLDVRFVVLAPPGAEADHNHEATDQRWVSIDELPGLGADAGLMRLARAGMAQARRVLRRRSG